MVRLLLTVPLLFGLSAGLAAAPLAVTASGSQTVPAPAAAKAKRKKPRVAAPAAAVPAASLNAPSMDFTGVTPETGETADPRRGPSSNIRPTINSNGQPAMGLGF